MRKSIGVLVLSSTLQAAWAAPDGAGLRVNTETKAWPQWQARLAVVTAPLNVWQSFEGMGPARTAMSLSGDRYFNIGKIGDGGGLRATGALLFGSATLAQSGADAFGPASLLVAQSRQGQAGTEAMDLTPYVGMGYSAWWQRAGLGLSADLGLLARKNQANRWLNNDTFEEWGHGMLLTPRLQVKLSYSF